MKLEVGKFYRTRDGRKAKVVYIEPDILENGERTGWIIDGILTVGYENGMFYYDIESSQDLIAPWEEPPPPRKLYAYTDSRASKLFPSIVFYLNPHLSHEFGLIERAPEYDLEYPGGR